MNIAILGFGVVGSGAYDIAKQIAKEEGDIKVTRVLCRKMKPEYEGLDCTFTTDIDDILNDSSIDVVIESIGGIEPARSYVLSCLKAGKHVVTPNKSLISACYEELFETAMANNVSLHFTSTSGGGIPWLYNLRRTKRCNSISEIHGIINGTCNYILSRMFSEECSFKDALAGAQELGYAEADPSADIKGIDTRNKTVISGNIAFDTIIKPEDVACYGIDTIEACDIKWFKEHGYSCKLLMNASKLSDEAISAYVEPSLVSSASLEANVNANLNLISLTADGVGPLSFYGQGAGHFPTGESVIQDVLDIKEGIDNDLPCTCKKYKVDNSAEIHKYYIRHDTMCEHISPLIESYEEKDGLFYCISKPLSVEKMHSMGKRRKEKGKPMFFAAIK